ncbi:hypothetical protein KUH03_27430 [Sphingobacterium sp. E70]|uniref:hypothetical protein n=1 Tax=Sphingobacterium sp. E70 TaxID=2853439 RepID=UPI00211BD67D|nr:hypothetical protein [Sphingobacterium sp. E70]ULT22973.1 hypothetical protein KUH03_27430 [Sphingobacterium sp. E70]
MNQETNLYRNSSKTVKLLAMSGGICVILLLTFLYCIGLFDGELKVKPAVFSGAALLVMLILLLSSLLSLRDKSAQIVLNKNHFSEKQPHWQRHLG